MDTEPEALDAPGPSIASPLARARRALRAALLMAALAVAGAPLLVAPPAHASAESGAIEDTHVELDPLSVPVVYEGRVQGQALIHLALAYGRPELRESVMTRRPALTDAFFRDLYRYGAMGRMDKGVFDLDGIKARLQRAADRIMGPGTVEVLIQGAQYLRAR